MAQTGKTPISLYYSATASNTPTAGNLVDGELAINTADGKLFYKDSAGVVQTMASKATTAGTYSSITTSNLTIGTTQLGAGNASIMKNRIINGAMVIDQRNAGASVTITTANQYTVDRWQGQASVSSKFTVQQNAGSVTPPVGFTNYLGCTSSAATSLGATDYYFVSQAIEGYNIADLGWGTANAKAVTISFWVRSSLTGTFGGALTNGSDAWCPFGYTISSANTWEYKTVSVAGPTIGTWNTTNSAGVSIRFSLGIGSTYTGGTSGTWTSTVYSQVSGSTSVVGTSGATFYITGVQLEVGSSATGFEYRQYTTELSLCQRYYWKQTYQQANTRFGTGLATGDATVDGLLINLPVTMRTVPTNAVNAIGVYDGTATRTITALNTSYSSPDLFAQQATASSSITAGKVLQIYATSSTAFVSSSAEL